MVQSYAVQMALTIYTTQPPWVEDGNQRKVVYTLMNTRSILERKTDRTQSHDIIDIPISSDAFFESTNTERE